MGRQIASDCGHVFTREKLAELSIAVTSEEAAQIFTRFALSRYRPSKRSSAVGNVGREATITDRTRRGLMQPQGAADTEVVSIQQPIRRP